MIRLAHVLKVFPDRHEDYFRRHNPIWEELAATLKAHGVHNYSIFLHAQTSQLFVYVEVEDEARWAAIAETEVCRRWWVHMAEVMETNEDLSPRATRLAEVFHLD